MHMLLAASMVGKACYVVHAWWSSLLCTMLGAITQAACTNFHWVQLAQLVLCCVAVRAGPTVSSCRRGLTSALACTHDAPCRQYTWDAYSGSHEHHLPCNECQLSTRHGVTMLGSSTYCSATRQA